MKATRHAAALLLAVLASSTLAASEGVASAQTSKAESDKRAHDLFVQGDKAYAEARYEDALASFKDAYALSQRPQLLFNIANALERLGRYAEAADALDKYLASGKAKDKDTVAARLANLKKRVEDQKKADDEKAAKEEAEKKKAEEAERKKKEDDERRAREAREQQEKPAPILPWVLVGGGGVLVATGAVFGVLTLGARSDVKSGCKDAPAGHLCDASVSSAISREKTFGLVADLSILAGLVAGGVGAYLLITTPKTNASVQVGVGRVDLVGRF